MDNNELLMKRCIELASNGLGYTAPNPMVGSVIVHEGKIIGEGYHKAYGQPHAEVNAINSVKNQELLPHSTLYVNLEPCCHYGKTPPCTDLIIEKGIKKVVIGIKDPFPEVAGKGIEKLKKNGVAITTGVLENECIELNKRFITYNTNNRPYIILKWAQTADGFIDMDRDRSITTRPTWITSQNLKVLVHKWRHQEQAIIVGTNTALSDNPKLNVREWFGNDPLRLVVDQNLVLPESLALFDNSISTIVLNEKIEKQNENTDYCKLDFSVNIEQQILDLLFKRKIQSLIIEGGRMILQGFIDNNLWDEARIFHGTQFFGCGIKAPLIYSNNKKTYNIANERVFHLINDSNNYYYIHK
jgi:diaminohydroxyphosphoribosylaminopyrimidine deaminase / 5-amino-6-(5-phosphoribosylamino)uracil reductase